MSAFIQVVNSSNIHYFNNINYSDVIIRTGDETQKIFISPITGINGNAICKITGSGMDVLGDTVTSGALTVGNITINNGVLSNVNTLYTDGLSTSFVTANQINLPGNNIITFDSNDNQLKYGTPDNLVAFGDTTGYLSSASNLSDLENSQVALENLGMGTSNTVTFSNINVTGDYYKNGAILGGDGTQVLFNFTGQHRCLLDYNLSNYPNLSGLVVVSDKNTYVPSAMTLQHPKLETINDAIPVVSISSKVADKSAFGVISQGIDFGVKLDNGAFIDMTNSSDYKYKEKGDTRFQINSIGEGCIWVIEDDQSTYIEAGDLVMTSMTPGYSTIQGDDTMKSYTVAKVTRSCDWNPIKVPVQRVVTNPDGTFKVDPNTKQTVFENYIVPESIDENGNLVPEHIEMESEYILRYVRKSDGAIVTEEEWNEDNVNIKRAALLGCTYHCG